MKPILMLVIASLPVAGLAQDAATAAGPAVDCGIWEAIEPADTLATIARRCGVSEAALADLNSHLDPTRLPMGQVVTITPFEWTPRPEEISGPSDDPILNAYRADVRGTWEGDGGTCDTLAGSWTFDDRFVRGNATVFALDGLYGTEDRIVLDTTRAVDGAAVRLVVYPDGRQLALKSEDFTADLRRCDGDRADAATAPITEDEAVYTYVESVGGVWRGTDATCGAVVGTWNFAERSITANGTVYTILSIDADGGGTAVTTRRATDGEDRVFQIVPTSPEAVRVTGPDFVTDLVRCCAG